MPEPALQNLGSRIYNVMHYKIFSKGRHNCQGTRAARFLKRNEKGSILSGCVLQAASEQELVRVWAAWAGQGLAEPEFVEDSYHCPGSAKKSRLGPQTYSFLSSPRTERQSSGSSASSMGGQGAMSAPASALSSTSQRAFLPVYS